MPGVLDQNQLFAVEGRVKSDVIRDEPVAISTKDA